MQTGELIAVHSPGTVIQWNLDTQVKMKNEQYLHSKRPFLSIRAADLQILISLNLPPLGILHSKTSRGIQYT